MRAPRHDDVGAAPARLVAGDAQAQLLSDEGARRPRCGAESSCEIGQKARTPPIVTSTPPLLTPVTTPSTGSPCWKAASSSAEPSAPRPPKTRFEHDAARRAADLDDGGGELVALLHRQRAVGVAQLGQLDDAVGLGAEIDERGVAADGDDASAHLVTDGRLLALLLDAAGLGAFVFGEQLGELVFVA